MEGQRQDGVKKDISHTGRNRVVRNKQKKQICISYRCIRIDICIYIYSQTCYLLYFIIKYIITVYFFFTNHLQKNISNTIDFAKEKKDRFFKSFEKDEKAILNDPKTQEKTQNRINYSYHHRRLYSKY